MKLPSLLIISNISVDWPEVPLNTAVTLDAEVDFMFIFVSAC